MQDCAISSPTTLHKKSLSAVSHHRPVPNHLWLHHCIQWLRPHAHSLSLPLLGSAGFPPHPQVHERHLSTDFLLALLRAIAMQRPALRVVLMSATINVTAYSDYFGGVPIISVPGRLHPIKVRPVPSLAPTPHPGCPISPPPPPPPPPSILTH